MKIPRLQWVIAAMLFLATALNYTDRLALSVVSPQLRQDFGMSEQDYSQVVTIFLLAYAIMYAWSGYLVDRLGTRVGYSLTMAFWSLAAMAHAFVGSLLGFAAARFALGFGEAGVFPASLKAAAIHARRNCSPTATR